MKQFVLTGAAGYIAPRHMKAIKDTGNDLAAAYDPNDSVGVIDSHFPDAEFFNNFEELALFLDQRRRMNKSIDFFSIASPNYMHHSHIVYALSHGAHAICEKPLVVDPKALDDIEQVEKETGKKLFNILQLRLHPSLIALKEKIAQSSKETYDVDLSYITSRGKWYHKSWKSDINKSGGIATNIGIHFFDMLTWIFGPLKSMKVHHSTPETAAGFMALEKARVRWFLSLDVNYVPGNLRAQGQRTFRSITVDSSEIEFSGGFTDLHTVSYENILSGGGFGLDIAKDSIFMVNEIRYSP